MTPATSFTVTVSPDVMADIETHCFSRLDVEVGGFLLGTIDGDRVDVRAARRAADVTAAQTKLTFTHETWNDVLDALPTEYAGQRIVGWYHSHPGFGCFLSEYDIFIQENFFSAPGQHALVVDPLAGRWARFVAHGGASTEVGGGDTVTPALAGPGGTASVDKVDLAAAPSRRRALPIVTGAVIGAVVVAALAWFVGTMQGQDAASAQGASALSAARDEIAGLQAQLAAAQAATPAATPTSQSTSEPGGESPSSATSNLPTLSGDVLAIGEAGTFALHHTIVRGDTLWDLARRYLGDPGRYRELLRGNPDVRANGLEPGQVLKIRLPGTLESVG